jgi:predicted GTPase
MIVEHSKTIGSKQPLLLIIIGFGGTGKSYLIHAILNLNLNLLTFVTKITILATGGETG